MGEFRERLVQMMEERGMRQVDLMNKTGIERSIISAYVRGRYTPRDDRLQLLAKALNCDAMWLAGYDGVEAGDESAFLAKFRMMKAEDKKTIMALMNFFADSERRNNEGK